jgi:purine-cytosine permease-like protein
MGVASIGLVLLGSLVWDAAESLTAASLMLLALTGPWAAIVGVGHLRARGRYLTDDLQAFNRRQRGGAYWFTAGWNWRALLAWAVGAAVGLATVTTTLDTGPLADVAGGLDVSFVSSFAITGTLYLLLETVLRFGSRPALAPATVQDQDG